MDGFNAPRRFRIVAENAPQAVDDRFEHGFSDHGPRPNRVEESRLGNELFWTFGQVQEYRIVFRA
jgi:hypothetical protein